MTRARPTEIAKLTGIHASTVRRWVDVGILEARKDFRGWRWFPDPKKTVERIEGLLDGEIKLK